MFFAFQAESVRVLMTVVSQEALSTSFLTVRRAAVLVTVSSPEQTSVMSSARVTPFRFLSQRLHDV